MTNYRGITLLSTLGKLFTCILNNRLNKWAEEYNVYVKAQAGFRKNMGTVYNFFFILSGLITHILNNNDSLFALLLTLLRHLISLSGIYYGIICLKLELGVK